MSSDPPLVSCLCVTEGRAPFLPWLLWGFERQTWRNKELVIVDSSPRPCCRPTTVDRARVVTAPPGTNVPAKRNVALREARGRYVAWFDDDDWQHPERLDRMAGALAAGVDLAGSTTSFFVDLFTLGCYRYAGRGHVIFNSAVLVAEVARAVHFDEKVARASDRAWMDAVMRATLGRTNKIDDAVYTFWLCHDQNLSNPRGQRPLCFPIDLVKSRIGAAAWGDTDEQLRALVQRLSEP